MDEFHINASCRSAHNGGKTGTVKIPVQLTESEFSRLVNNRAWAKAFAERMGAGEMFDARDGRVVEAKLMRGGA